MLINCQDSNGTPKQQISLDQVYNISLGKRQKKLYTVTVKDLKAEQSLFIEANSPSYNLYQEPEVIVRSQNNFQLLCIEHDNQYFGICQINNENLKENKKIEVQVKCYQKCRIKLQVFLSDTYEVDFGHKIQTNAMKVMGTVKQFKIQIPKDTKFTDIAIITKITNKQDIQEGIQMYVNVGNQSVPLPTSQKYDHLGRSVWGSGAGVFLNQQRIKPQDWIKVYLILGQGVKAEFYTQAITDNKYQILINTFYEDFTSDNATKIYILDLKDELNAVNNDTEDSQSLQNQTIEIVLVIYSGYPEIKVGFDEKLGKYIDNYDIQGTIGYLITPQIRKKYGFLGKIYIQISSQWSSDYQIFTYLVSNQFVPLNDAISHINTAKKNQTQNYLYESLVVLKKKEQQMQSYRIKLQLISGNAELVIRRCLSMEKVANFDCLIINRSQFQKEDVKKQFDQTNITVRKSQDDYEVFFDYNVTKCQFYRSFGNLSMVYNCQFQIIVFPNPNGQDQDLVYSITIFQNNQIASLKQGYVFKDYVYKETYHYYNFELPSLTNVQEVTFFLTVISGDAGLMGTTYTKYQYMQLKDSLFEDAISTIFLNTLTFTKQKLADKFYLAVYAYETTELTLNVIVKRSAETDKNTTGNQTKENKTMQSTIYLVQGLSQQYTLGKSFDNIDFSFMSNSAKSITVQIIEIQGSINYNIFKQGSDVQVQCENKMQIGQRKCTFSAEQGSKYLVHINASKQDIETFTISHFYHDRCKKYPFNIPQFIFLSAKDTQCSIYSLIDSSRSLQILTSFSTLDFLSTKVTFQITFNDQHKIEFSERSKSISSDQVAEFCKNQKKDNCQMKISLRGDPESNVQFYYVVEQEGKQMVLFDGIIRKVIDKQMTQKKGKHFYYSVTSMIHSVKIFTINRNNVGYYIGAKFVEELNFTAIPDSLYLPYRQVNQDTLKEGQNIFETRLNAQKGTLIVQIQANQFRQYCTACVMLISVYGLQTESSSANIFEIQVTQQQSFIHLGQQKTGLLSEDQIYAYEINGNPDTQSFITIRDLLKESQMQENCFKVNIIKQDTNTVSQIKTGYRIMQASYDTYKVVIQNIGQDMCTYQISYSTLLQSISVITPFMTNELKLSNSQSKYFLYNHISNNSFQILTYIKSGDLKVYANKIDSNNTIESSLNKKLDQFDFKSVPGVNYLYVDQNENKKFCTNCYYMVAVKGDLTAHAQIGISVGQQTIGLTTYGLLKQSLAKDQKQNYSFYSITDFNISISILYGELKVTVKNPDNKSVYNKIINMSTQIFVPRPITVQSQFVDYYSQNSRFQIEVQALKESRYYITVKRKNVTIRIYQGVPMIIQLYLEQNTLEFVNTNSEDNVSVLLQIKNQISQDFVIQAFAQVMKEGQVQTKRIDNPKVQRSEKSFNFVFNSIKGTYFISFKSKQSVNASLILAKKKLTHLMSSNANLFLDQGIFETYTPGHNLIIVVDSCKNQVEVKASDSYQAIIDQDHLQDSDSVLLEHANYGGHYIITAEIGKGEYFVKVSPKQPNNPMLYIISYYYYDINDAMPYKKVDIKSQIIYELKKDKIIFILSPVRVLSSKNKPNISSTYTLYISNSSEASTMTSRCDLSYGFSLTQTNNSNNTQPIKFAVDYQTITKYVGEETSIYFVSAKVKVKFQDPKLNSDYPPFVDLAYTTTPIIQANHKIQFKQETNSNIKDIFMWVIVPILLALVLFVFALKFCIKKYSQLHPDILVQEDKQNKVSQIQINQPYQSATNI